MSRWWRAYDDAINHPKLLRLSDELFRAWFTLLCIASKNGGILPSAADIAVILRMKPVKVADWLTKLSQARLIDKVDGLFVPHNWNVRQFKSDVSTDRVKRHRKNRRNVSCNVSSAVSETAPEQSRTDTEHIVADAEDARGRQVNDQAIQLVDELLLIAGHDPGFVPPGWCCAAMRVQTWLANGWSRETIIAATTAAARRKHGAPANSVQFFEKAIAEEVARQAAPLPQVEVRQLETLKVFAHGKQQQGGIIQAADRLIETLRAFDAGPDEFDEIRGGSGAYPVRQLSRR